MARDPSHLDPSSRAANSPEVSRAAMGQHRPIAASKHRRHPFAAQTDAAMAESKHAAMERDEGAVLYPRLDQPNA